MEIMDEAIEEENVTLGDLEQTEVLEDFEVFGFRNLVNVVAFMIMSTGETFMFDSNLTI